MEQLLTSASVILAAITFLFSAWSSQIEEMRDLSTDDHYANLRSEHQKLKKTLFSKAIPLSIVSSIMTLIFLPEVIDVLKITYLTVINSSLWTSCKYYDANRAVLIFIEVSFIVISIYLWAIVRELLKKKGELEKMKLIYDSKFNQMA